MRNTLTNPLIEPSRAKQFGFPTRSNTNRFVMSQKKARSLKFRNGTIRVAKTKALNSCAVTAPLFSHMKIVSFLMRRLNLECEEQHFRSFHKEFKVLSHNTRCR